MSSELTTYSERVRSELLFKLSHLHFGHILLSNENTYHPYLIIADENAEFNEDVNKQIHDIIHTCDLSVRWLDVRNWYTFTKENFMSCENINFYDWSSFEELESYPDLNAEMFIIMWLKFRDAIYNWDDICDRCLRNNKITPFVDRQYSNENETYTNSEFYTELTEALGGAFTSINAQTSPEDLLNLYSDENSHDMQRQTNFYNTQSQKIDNETKRSDNKTNVKMVRKITVL